MSKICNLNIILDAKDDFWKPPWCKISLFLSVVDYIDPIDIVLCLWVHQIVQKFCFGWKYLDQFFEPKIVIF